jgi:hypothetical protein
LQPPAANAASSATIRSGRCVTNELPA